MRIFAYCTFVAREAVKAATGVEPLTSPPLDAATFPIKNRKLQGCDLIYFRLHTLPQHPLTWFGEETSGRLIPALDERFVESVNLGGAVVVVANCHGLDNPLVGRLYDAGARIVIAGAGPNLAAAKRVVGVDLLTKWLIRGLRRGMKPKRALQLAKVRLLATAWRGSDRDALKFKILEVKR